MLTHSGVVGPTINNIQKRVDTTLCSQGSRLTSSSEAWIWYGSNNSLLFLLLAWLPHAYLICSRVPEKKTSWSSFENVADRKMGIIKASLEITDLASGTKAVSCLKNRDFQQFCSNLRKDPGHPDLTAHTRLTVLLDQVFATPFLIWRLFSMSSDKSIRLPRGGLASPSRYAVCPNQSSRFLEVSCECWTGCQRFNPPTTSTSNISSICSTIHFRLPRIASCQTDVSTYPPHRIYVTKESDASLSPARRYILLLVMLGPGGLHTADHPVSRLRV